MNESGLINKIKDELKGKGLYYQKLSDRYTGGIPDLIIIKTGDFYAVECKMDSNAVTKLQELALTNIALAGGFAYAIRYSNTTKLYRLFRWVVSFTDRNSVYKKDVCASRELKVIMDIMLGIGGPQEK